MRARHVHFEVLACLDMQQLYYLQTVDAHYIEI
jgi:poly-beta-hydroxyalkanoate depolymerase